MNWGKTALKVDNKSSYFSVQLVNILLKIPSQNLSIITSEKIQKNRLNRTKILLIFALIKEGGFLKDCYNKFVFPKMNKNFQSSSQNKSFP
jgi:hypothetical protein